MKNGTIAIGIDTGGTFTDCYVRYGDSSTGTKSPTTPQDISKAVIRCIEDAARELGLTTEDLLKQADSVYYSGTLATNALIQRKGPRLGLMTTRGFEDIIYMGRGSQWQDGLSLKEKRKIPVMSKPEPLIPRELTVGLRERIDSSGQVALPLNEEDVREKLRYLVDKGVRSIVVCLLFSHLNPVHERRVRDIIVEEYPDFYLGSMPVIISSDVLPKQGEYGRFMTTILNSYLQQSMVGQLNSLVDTLRRMGYSKSLKMIHNTGGMADLSTTMPVQTYNGGPVAGLVGSAWVSRLYGAGNAILTDMGGTSFDMGVVVEGNPRFYTFWPTIDRWLTGITTLECRSIGAGGGSIAWINEAFHRLEVGPQSAEAVPGPACYGRGGQEPTVTDADVVLGYINPDSFHGGKLRLNKDKAYQSIGKISRYFQVDAVEAALMVKKVVDANMGNNLYKETVLRGFDPRDFVLFAYGGAGPTHCAEYNKYIGTEKIIVFRHSPEFCAFGCTLMDRLRVYEQAKYLQLTEPGTKKLVCDAEEFNTTVLGLREKAIRDLVADQVDPKNAVFSLELDMKFGAHIHTFRCCSPRVFIEGKEDAEALYDEFIRQYADFFGQVSVVPEAGVVVQSFALRALVPQPKPELPRFRLKPQDPRGAFLKRRPVFWEDAGTYVDTATYDMNLLECGNIMEGPAIVEAPNTTMVVPPGMRYSVDEYLNGVLEKV